MSKNHFPSDDEALRQQVTHLAAQCNVVEYQFLKSLAELLERDAWHGAGVRSCAHWLNFHCGICESAGREKIRVAKCLGDLPLIDQAFCAGEVSFSMVRAMTRVATPENEACLLNIARHGTAGHMERVVRKYRNTQAHLEDEIEQKQRQARRLDYYQEQDGSWVIRARLPAEEGSLVVKALAAVAAPIQRRDQDKILEKSRSRRAGDQSETLEEQVQRESPHSYAHEMRHTQADALITVAEHFLATCGESRDYQHLAANERCQVMVHVDINTLHEQPHESACTHPQCNLDQRQWISPATARRLSCDASLLTVLEDGNGKVLNIGRRSRSIPYRMRKALQQRDPSCRFPGCTCDRGIEYHHVKHWADGGETRLSNLIGLCRNHHRLLHRGVFRIKPGNSQFIFVTASGQRMESVRSPQFAPDAVLAAKANLAATAARVDHRTCVPLWYGDHPDYGTVIDGLLDADRRRFS